MPIIKTDKTMRQRSEHDFYPTPEPLVRAALETYLPYLIYDDPTILDPGAGDGVFGKVARELYPKAFIAGVDVRPLVRPAAYDYWLTGGYDFPLNTNEAELFKFVIGNPPYKFAEEFIRTGFRLLEYGGVMMYLLRLNLLGSDKRGRGLWCELPPAEIAVCAQRPSFTGDGGTDADTYAFFIWRKHWAGNRYTPRLSWLNWR